MWPFKKNKNREERRADCVTAQIAELKAFRDIGDTFFHLGRTCIVTSHSTWLPGLGWAPRLSFDYCDDLGVLHSREAGPHELPALRIQNPEEAA